VIHAFAAITKVIAARHGDLCCLLHPLERGSGYAAAFVCLRRGSLPREAAPTVAGDRSCCHAGIAAGDCDNYVGNGGSWECCGSAIAAAACTRMRTSTDARETVPGLSSPHSMHRQGVRETTRDLS